MTPEATSESDPTVAVTQRLARLQRRIAAELPFFAVLCLHAHHVVRDDVPTAQTDGRSIEYGTAFASACDDAELTGLVLHEVLHCALAHVPRGHGRVPNAWNAAADVTVNALIDALDPAFVRLPGRPIREPRLAHLATESIYELLLEPGSAFAELIASDTIWDLMALGPSESSTHLRSPGHRRDLERYWTDALAQARAIERARGEAGLFGRSGRGDLAALLDRRVDERLAPAVDWRHQLWAHMARVRDDFDGFDRRFFAQGIYLEQLETDGLNVVVCVDTSGSVGKALLTQFFAELKGVATAFPNTRVRLFYADAALDGPHELSLEATLPPPRGGGGTSFVPFFEWLGEHTQPHDGVAVVYLTDGFGAFPRTPPEVATVLWVVPHAGAVDAAFPFGSVVRIGHAMPPATLRRPPPRAVN